MLLEQLEGAGGKMVEIPLTDNLKAQAKIMGLPPGCMAAMSYASDPRVITR